MKNQFSVVVTSVSAPNPVLRSLASGCRERELPFFVVGDVRSPADFQLEGCSFYSLERQRQTGLRFAAICPERHYARKNIGYLLAIQAGAEIIAETDDDNFPRPTFWNQRQRRQRAAAIQDTGCVNTHAYFSDVTIWPRGLPLEAVHRPVPSFETLVEIEADCPIQMGLVDGDPDVDAIYRLILPLPITFRCDRRIAIGHGSWSPFNSQNTTWWADAYPLMYLPSYCSFRMTDIWRSFVAQRIAWTNSWSILIHEPTVHQERNVHNLIRDFEDEVPGYLHNMKIIEKLEGLRLVAGAENISANIQRCYEALVELSVIGSEELPLLEAWLADLAQLRRLARSDQALARGAVAMP